jgi:hypothetical protein
MVRTEAPDPRSSRPATAGSAWPLRVRRVHALRFAVKHAVATGVTVVGIVAFTAASYFALLA